MSINSVNVNLQPTCNNCQEDLSSEDSVTNDYRAALNNFMNEFKKLFVILIEQMAKELKNADLKSKNSTGTSSEEMGFEPPADNVETPVSDTIPPAVSAENTSATVPIQENDNLNAESLSSRGLALTGANTEIYANADGVLTFLPFNYDSEMMPTGDKQNQSTLENVNDDAKMGGEPPIDDKDFASNFGQTNIVNTGGGDDMVTI